MKRWAILLFLLVILTGCERGLTNDEIIREVKECEEAGLVAAVGYRFFGGVMIICLPKKTGG